MADLAYVLRQLPQQNDPSILTGTALGDDAAVYRLTDDIALVQTVDFFTPVVDDPYAFGQIAAANSLSDVYAVGGSPLTALNIVGFPVDELPKHVLAEMLRGGADKAREAGVSIVGGHTIDDPEPKYGLAVTGTVRPDAFLSGRGAQPGDLLVLTKPLGTGVITTALKAGAAETAHIDAAVRWMVTLNRDASRAMVHAGAHAVSDITGYGLLGHLLELCRVSGVSARLHASRVPLLPGALRYASEEFVPAGTGKNLAAVTDSVTFHPSVDENWVRLLTDPQTSGGLLVALPADRFGLFEREAGPVAIAAVVGEVVESASTVIDVVL